MGPHGSESAEAARGFRDYIRLFRAVEHAADRPLKRHTTQHGARRRGRMKAERIYSRGETPPHTHNALTEV